MKIKKKIKLPLKIQKFVHGHEKFFDMTCLNGPSLYLLSGQERRHSNDRNGNYRREPLQSGKSVSNLVRRPRLPRLQVHPGLRGDHGGLGRGHRNQQDKVLFDKSL